MRDSEEPAGGQSRGRILWADDEVDMLRPHLMTLRRAGYVVDPVMNGADALELLSRWSYDLMLLDERMPGLRGIEVLERVRREAPRLPVVMVTKSEEDSTLREAIGRRAEDYIVKPTSPRQVLSVVTRLLAGPALRHEFMARDFTRLYPRLAEAAAEASSWRDYANLYSQLVDWQLRLDAAREAGLAETLDSLLTEARRGYCDLVAQRYGQWVHEGGARGPPLSVDIMPRFFGPLVREDESTLIIVMDCMRLDQWRAIRPHLEDFFEIEESLYSSVLPTATPFSRNGIFTGLFADELAEVKPDWWAVGDNSPEAELFQNAVERAAGRRVKTHYERVFTRREAGTALANLGGVLSTPGATALVFGFVDLLTHGRAESRLLWEIAGDPSALRSLTTAWFERSPALDALRLAARLGVRTLVTTDHGSIHCHRPTTVFAGPDASRGLRYKIGNDIRAENPDNVYSARDADELRLPPGGLRQSYVLCREDYFFVYPTKLNEYRRRYRNSFLHGGVSLEEMVLPVALLTPR